MSSARDPSARLSEILERNRADVAPDFPQELLAEIAQIEEQNQFDDDRRPAKQRIREAVANAMRTAELAAGEPAS
jgi:hypothetical protein